VNRGGYGAWELAARYSTLDLNDAGVSGGEMDVYSLGVNWWLTSASQFSLNYRYVDLDRFGLNGQSSGVNVRLLLVLD
jgi:phosphate-selective porin OprO/OprP